MAFDGSTWNPERRSFQPPRKNRTNINPFVLALLCAGGCLAAGTAYVGVNTAVTSFREHMERERMYEALMRPVNCGVTPLPRPPEPLCK